MRFSLQEIPYHFLPLTEILLIFQLLFKCHIAFKPSPASAGFLCALMALVFITVATGIILNCQLAGYMPALLFVYNS